MAGVKGKSGGLRAGAGRKPMDLSEEEVATYLKEVKKTAKREKTTVGSELAKMIFKEPDRRGGFTWRDKLASIKLHYDITIVKRSHQTHEGEIFHKGPIEIPAVEWDHAKNEEERLELERVRLEQEKELRGMRH